MFSADHILVFLPNWVGDAVMATPALRALRRTYAEAELVLLGKGAVLQAVADDEICDGVIEAPSRGLRGFLGMVRRLRRRRFDLAVLLPNSFRAAAMAWAGGAARRVGYARDGRGWMLTDKVKPPRDERGKFRVYPAVQYYIDLVESLGIAVEDRRMRLSCDDLPAEAQLAEAGYDPARPMVMLNPGGAFGPSKMWQAERYAAVADALAERYDAQIIVNAAPPERDAVAAVGRAMKHTPLIDFAKRDNTIALLKSLVRRCDLLITNDTGARHIAAALGTAVVTVFGSTDPNWTTIDYDRERIVRVDVPCGPCQQKVCNLPPGPEHHQCMTGVTTEMVLAAAGQLIPAGKGASS